MTTKTPELLWDLFAGIGMVYIFGCVGGAASHFFKAFRNSTNRKRLISGIQSARINAPRCASSFVFWGAGVYNVSASTLAYLRQNEEEDSWDSIIAATATAMLYNRRLGFVPAAKRGLRWGAALGIGECGLFAFAKTGESLDQQRLSGKTEKELLRLQPMIDNSALWFRNLLGSGELESTSITSIPITPDDTQTQGLPQHYWDIISGVGLACMLGGVGGSASHFLKAFCNSPNGQRLVIGIQSARANAPRCANSFVFWGAGFYTASAHALAYLRQKQDSWDSIIAAIATAMLYKWRQGFGPAAKLGFCCGTAVCIGECGKFAFVKTAESLQQQRSSGKTEKELLRLQPMVDNSALWFRTLLDRGAEEPEDTSTGK